MTLSISLKYFLSSPKFQMFFQCYKSLQYLRGWNKNPQNRKLELYHKLDGKWHLKRHPHKESQLYNFKLWQA